MRHTKEKSIIISSWFIILILMVTLVPKHKIREAQVSFLFKQIMTWLFGLIVVEKGLISYPYRLFFKHTIKSSFTFEYFVYPAMCALFNVFYPEKRSLFFKTLYYTLHCALITSLEIFALKKTKLINYKHWTWYYTFATLWITYYASRVYSRWFFKPKEHHAISETVLYDRP